MAKNKAANEKDKIISVLALTGKVGKSTFVNHCLIPRMPSTKLFRLETINLSGMSEADATVMRGKDFVKLQNELSKIKSAIIDVGASNVENFILQMTQQTDSHQAYDCFIIPIEATSAKADAIDEFIKMVSILHKLGVEPDRIKVVFNKLAFDADLEYEMRKIIKFHELEPWFTLNLSAVVHESACFAALSEVGITFEKMLTDTTNYRQEFRETPVDTPENLAKRLQLTKLMRAQSSIKPVNDEFEDVFQALFGE
jgi:hypothetical protein